MIVSIVLEESEDRKIYLFVQNDIISTWRGLRTHLVGKPLEFALAIEKSFAAANVECTLEVIQFGKKIDIIR